MVEGEEMPTLFRPVSETFALQMNSELGALLLLGVRREELHFLLFDLQSAVCVQQGFLKCVFNKW